MRNALLVTVFVGLLAACAGNDSWVSTDFDDSPSRVVVNAGNGFVTVDGTTSGSGSSVEVDERGGEADVQIDIDENNVMTVSDSCDPDTDCEADYVIRLTAGSDVEVTALNGDVLIGELTGDMTVTTGGGNVSLASSVGAIRVDTGGGDVLGTQLQAGSAAVDTFGGIADLTFNEPIDDLAVSTDGGRLTVQLAGGPYALNVDAGGGTTSVLVDEDDSSSRRVELQSGGGNVTVYRR